MLNRLKGNWLPDISFSAAVKLASSFWNVQILFFICFHLKVQTKIAKWRLLLNNSSNVLTNHEND